MEDLFDAAASAQARDAALTRVGDANEAWKKRAYFALQELARSKPEFTSDDVWSAVSESPAEPRAMGAVIMDAARAGIIQPTETWKCSARVACHRRPLRVWKSLLWRAS